MTNAKKILIVNPGSTSTKIGLYDTDCMVFNESVGHSAPPVVMLSRADSIETKLMAIALSSYIS